MFESSVLLDSHILFCGMGLHSFFICPPRPLAQQHLLSGSLLGRTGLTAARFKSHVSSRMLLCGKKGVKQPDVMGNKIGLLFLKNANIHSQTC